MFLYLRQLQHEAWMKKDGESHRAFVEQKEKEEKKLKEREEREASVHIMWQSHDWDCRNW